MNFKDLTGKERGDVVIHCPLHFDNNPSASVNFQKGVFNCFAGCGGMTIEELERKLSENPKEEKEEESIANNTITDYIKPEELWKQAEEYLESRRVLDLLEGKDPCTSVSLVDNRNNNNYGCLVFSANGVRVARNLLHESHGGPKYIKDPKTKGLFVLDGTDLTENSVWLTEGVFDALSLRKCGIQNVVALLGSGANEERLFQFKGKTVFLLFDNDWPGYKGARECYEKLLTLEANPIIVDLPEDWNDPNDALVKDEDSFRHFLHKTTSQFVANDLEFVKNMSSGIGKMTVLPSGISRLDYILGGGFREGLHVIGAEPGVGKTAFCSYLVSMTKEKKYKTLVNTCEVSRLQYWSRIASTESNLPWEAIEFEPSLLEPDVQKSLIAQASRIKVVHGWELEKILYSIDEYDVVVIDYLQVMPSPITDSLQKVKKIIQNLALVASQKGKVIICVSSLSRSGYDDRGLGIFKESGDIEYSAESAIKLSPSFHNPNIITFDVRKNRRGITGKADVVSDLAHCTFKEVDYELLEKMKDG